MTGPDANTAPAAGADPRGVEALARNGERLGVIGDVLTDAGPPPEDFVLLQTGAWPFHKKFAVPLALVTFQDGKARLPVTADRFDGAPEWRDGETDFYRFRDYWQPPMIGGSETVSDADVLIGEEITGTMYSGTDLDTPAERAANTMRAAKAARSEGG